MKSIETRLSELEKRAGSGADNLTVFIVSFVRPGPNGPIHDEPTGYSIMRGNGPENMRWDRQPGETLDELKARAEREVPRNAGGVAVLIESYA